jgi:hypothetical protein
MSLNSQSFHGDKEEEEEEGEGLWIAARRCNTHEFIINSKCPLCIPP